MGAGSTFVYVGWLCFTLLIVIGIVEIWRHRTKDYARASLGACHAAAGCFGGAVYQATSGRDPMGLLVIGILFTIYMIMAGLVALQDHKFSSST